MSVHLPNRRVGKRISPKKYFFVDKRVGETEKMDHLLTELFSLCMCLLSGACEQRTDQHHLGAILFCWFWGIRSPETSKTERNLNVIARTWACLSYRYAKTNKELSRPEKLHKKRFSSACSSSAMYTQQIHSMSFEHAFSWKFFSSHRFWIVSQPFRPCIFGQKHEKGCASLYTSQNYKWSVRQDKNK